jgi:type III restriction enzyme
MRSHPLVQRRFANAQIIRNLLARKPACQCNSNRILTKFVCSSCAHTSSPLLHITLSKKRHQTATGPKGGVAAKEDGTNSAFTTINEGDIELPDIITELQDKTQLTRASIVDILLKSSRIEDFKRNPQQFIDQAAEAIIRTKRLALVDGIKYQRIGDDDFYCQELFENEELKSYLKNAVPAKKSVFEYVVYDSEGTEKSFAEDLEANEAVKVYAKLPQWFKIPTPLGTYNPDWAILIEQDGEEKLYFVVETKSSSWWDDLRHQEGAKIKCGEKHFIAIASDPNPATYVKATSVDGLMKHV